MSLRLEASPAGRSVRWESQEARAYRLHAQPSGHPQRRPPVAHSTLHLTAQDSPDPFWFLQVYLARGSTAWGKVCLVAGYGGAAPEERLLA